MTRAAIMPRVSSEEQAGDSRLSIAAQRREMREFCARQGWEVVAEFEAEYESAWTHDIDKRPALRSALESALRREYDVLVVHDSTRFARNVELAAHLRRRFREVGARIVDMESPGFDTSTADGKFVTVIKDGTSEWWSDKISEATKKVKREQHHRGLHVGDAPFGYIGGHGHPLVIVQSEAQAVADAYRDYIAGASFTEIAQRLNAAGMRPRSKQGHTMFAIPAVQTILQNRVYAGFVELHGHEAMGVHEAIISAEMWEAAQTRVRRLEPRSRNRRMLSGVAACVHCRGPLWLTRHGRTGSPTYYYREPAKERGRTCESAGKMWRAERAEAEVDAIVRTLSMDRDWLADVARAARQAGRNTDHTAERTDVLRRKARVQEGYEAGVYDRTEWQRRIGELNARLATLTPVEPVNIAAAGERLYEFGQVWEVASTDRRREACRILFESILLDTSAKQLWVKPQADIEMYFDARRRVVCSLGPPGFEPSERTTGMLFTPAELGVSA